MTTRRQKSLIISRCISQRLRSISDKLTTPSEKLVGEQSHENRKIRGKQRGRANLPHGFKQVNGDVLGKKEARFASQVFSSAVLARHTQLEQKNKRYGRTGLGSELPHGTNHLAQHESSPSIECPSWKDFEREGKEWLNGISKIIPSPGKEDTGKNHERQPEL